MRLCAVAASFLIVLSLLASGCAQWHPEMSHWCPRSLNRDCYSCHALGHYRTPPEEGSFSTPFNVCVCVCVCVCSSRGLTHLFLSSLRETATSKVVEALKFIKF